MNLRPLLAAGLATASLAVPATGSASTEIVLAGSAVTAAGSCLTLAGLSSAATGRTRWAGGYWERITTPGPICSDTDPHFDPVISCINVVTIGEPGSPERRTIASIAATDPGRNLWRFVIIDRPAGTDEFGALKSATGSGPCGTDAVITQPVTAGGFTILGN